MAGMVGLEPTTTSLTVRRTTIVLHAIMEAVLGFEPKRSQSKCDALPIELHSYKLVCVSGFEPLATRFQSEDSDQTELHTDIKKPLLLLGSRGLL